MSASFKEYKLRTAIHRHIIASGLDPVAVHDPQAWLAHCARNGDEQAAMLASMHKDITKKKYDGRLPRIVEGTRRRPPEVLGG